MAIHCNLSAHARFQNVSFSRLNGDGDEAFSNLYTLEPPFVLFCFWALQTPFLYSLIHRHWLSKKRTNDKHWLMQTGDWYGSLQTDVVRCLPTKQDRWANDGKILLFDLQFGLKTKRLAFLLWCQNFGTACLKILGKISLASPKRTYSNIKGAIKYPLFWNMKRIH